MKVRHMCRSCSKKYHANEIELRLCELYHKEDMTSDDIFEYVSLKDEYEAMIYMKDFLQSNNEPK